MSPLQIFGTKVIAVLSSLTMFFGMHTTTVLQPKRQPAAVTAARQSPEPADASTSTPAHSGTGRATINSGISPTIAVTSASAPNASDSMYVTKDELSAQLSEFGSGLARIIAANTVAAPQPSNVPMLQSIAANGNSSNPFAAAQAISNISNATISNATISGGSVDASSIQGTITNAIQSATAAIASLSGTEVEYSRAMFDSATTTNLAVTGTSTISGLALAHVDCTAYGNGGKLTTDATGNVHCADDYGSSGGAGSPGGSSGQVQFNDAGSFAGSAGLTFDKSTNTLTITNASTTNLTSSYASSTQGFFGSLSLTKALGVASGGTGSTTLSGILKGSGTSPVSTAVAGVDYEAPLTFSSGLSRVGNAITLDTTGNWSGTLGSYSPAQLIAAGFSTTSAAYWQSQNNFFATTSSDYWFSQRSTSNLAEGSNLYYTNARVGTYISGSSTVPHVAGSAYGNVLYWNGAAWATMATSSLGISGGGGGSTTWGSITGTLSNQTDLQNALDAKLPLSSWYATTTDALKEGSTNLYFTNNRVAAVIAGTTTSALTEGSNLYFTNARADQRINATSTIGTLTSAPSLTTVSTGLTGIIKASAGVLSSALVNLASDVTGILPVGNGGTGWNNLTSGAVLIGNGSGAISTTTRGSLSETGSAILTITGGANALLGSGATIQVAQASGSQSGYLSSADWTTFNSKQSALTFSYPLQNAANTVSLAFGTTTANTWSQAQTFTNGLVSNGSIGIGVALPSANLTVQNDYGSTNSMLFLVSSSTAPDGSTASSFFSVSNTGVSTFGDASASGDASAQFGNDANAWSVGYKSSDKSFNIASSTNFTGTSALSIAKNGTVTIVGPSVTCVLGNGTSATDCSSSDERLKTNIATMDAGSELSLVLQLRPVTFTWNPWMQSVGAASTTQFGFIAQDVQHIFPNLVTQDANTGYFKLDYQGFIAPIVAALQEVSSISGSFRDSLIAWLGNAGNGIGDLFVSNVHAKNELCVGSTCITEAQLQALLAAANQPSAPAPAAARTDSTTTSVSEATSSPATQASTTPILDATSSSDTQTPVASTTQDASTSQATTNTATGATSTTP